MWQERKSITGGRKEFQKNTYTPDGWEAAAFLIAARAQITT